MEFLIYYVLIPLAVLTILVFVHEMGHFLVARYNNVRVEIFSIGFGKELFGFNDKHGTRWKFAAIPMGGYVKMFGEGENIEEEEKERPLTDAEKEVSFHHKRLGQRAAIVFAGPFVNFLFAVLVFASLFFVTGEPTPLSQVGTVQAGSAAEEAGITPGDRVISIDGKDVVLFEDLRQVVMKSANVSLSMEIIRDDVQLTIIATPKAHTRQENGVESQIGLLGVTPDPNLVEYLPLGIFDSLLMGVDRTYGFTVTILKTVGQMFSGAVSRQDLGGPIRIAQMAGDMAQGGLPTFFFFLAALSINLGLINLFPIPMLDGGHLLFYFFEAILGRPVNEKVQEYSFRFGLALILLLMVFVFWNDFENIKLIEKIRNLVS